MPNIASLQSIESATDRLLTEREHNYLPKWAQETIISLRQEIEQSQHKIRRLKSAHAVLDRKDWFIIPGPPPRSVEDGIYKLFYLSGEGAHPACSLGVGDVLLVGRTEK